MFAGKPCTGRETNPCRKLRIPRTCTGCCRVKKVPAWQVALIPSWSWLHMTEKGPHNKIITAGWWSPKRRTLLPVQIMKVSQQIFGWENFSVASNGQGPEIWHIFFKNHSSRTNKTETTQPSHSPWTPRNKQEINLSSMYRPIVPILPPVSETWIMSFFWTYSGKQIAISHRLYA